MNKRPSVQISTPNHLAELRQHLDTHLPQLKALPGVLGITLNGGMSRGFADHLSEIDVTLYLDTPTHDRWQSGMAPIATGITMIDGQLYDIKAVSLEHEQNRTWEAVALWDMSYAEILYDPRGKIAALLADKLTEYPHPTSAGGYLFGAWWHYRLAGDIWLHREDALQGHMMLNQAVVELLKALFTANGEYVPHEKWLLHMSNSLSWTPADWRARLAQALSSDATLESLKQRQSIIDSLWHDIDSYIIAHYAPGLPVDMTQKWFYDLLKRLADQGTMPVDDWQAVAGLDLLNQAPFHHVTASDGDTITLLRDQLLALTPDDLYIWHYQIIQAVAGRLSE